MKGLKNESHLAKEDGECIKKGVIQDDGLMCEGVVQVYGAIQKKL